VQVNAIQLNKERPMTVKTEFQLPNNIYGKGLQYPGHLKLW